MQPSHSNRDLVLFGFQYFVCDGLHFWYRELLESYRLSPLDSSVRKVVVSFFLLLVAFLFIY